MNAIRTECEAALDHANVRAWLVVIRAGESHPTNQEAYQALYGWKPGNGNIFVGFDDHPRIAKKSPWGWTSAAGAYQAMCAVPGHVKTDTWGDFIRACGPSDFGPRSQDVFAVWCTRRRGALQDVIAGRFEVAVKKCAKEWASLPGSPYGQPTKTMADALDTYVKHGGTFDPVEKEKDMAPFAAAALPLLIEAAPALIRIFGNGERSEKNAKAAEVVAEIAKEATAQPTIEGAVNAIHTDPQAAAAYREAIHQRFSDLVALSIQVSEAEDKSRAAALDRNLSLAKATGGRWLWLLGLVAGVVVIASYIITWRVLFGENVSLSDETKALLIGQIVIFGFAAVLQFLFGSSLSSKMKDRDRE